jgi:hypothetical protein
MGLGKAVLKALPLRSLYQKKLELFQFFAFSLRRGLRSFIFKRSVCDFTPISKSLCAILLHKDLAMINKQVRTNAITMQRGLSEDVGLTSRLGVTLVELLVVMSSKRSKRILLPVEDQCKH